MALEYQADGTPVWVDNNGRTAPVEFDDRGTPHPITRAPPPPPRPAWETYAGVRQQPGRPNLVLAQQMRAERQRSLIDPAVARAISQRAGQAVDLVSQIPHLNAGQLVTDTMQRGQTAWDQFAHDPLGSTGSVLAALPATIWGATGKPLVDLAQAGADESNAVNRGDPSAAESAAGRGVDAFGGTLLNATGAGVGSAVRTPLQGAALASALTLPTSIANSQGTLQERLPQAIVDTTGAAAIGGGLPLLARRRAPIAPNADLGSGTPHGIVSASTPTSRLQDFETAGVPPTLAATVGGTAADVTKTISENWLGGPFARSGLQRSIGATAGRARDLARRVGDVQDHEVAGEGVQAGVQRFAAGGNEPVPPGMEQLHPSAIPVRDWSFRAKANALYEHSLRPYEAAPATADATRSTMARFAGQARITPEPAIDQLTQVLNQRGQSLTLENLRTLREDVRSAQDPRYMTQTRNNAQLQQIESALTQDIYASTRRAGGPQAEMALRRTDRFYRAGMQRINGALRPFGYGPEGRPVSGATVYQNILKAARDSGSQNTPRLRALSHSLRPDEMRTVSASLLDEMGAPQSGRPGATEPNAFSVATFATEWSKLSDAGKDILFPHNLRSELEALARVADHQRVVEAMANNSRTSLRTQNLLTSGGVAGALYLHNPIAAAGVGATIAGMNITGAMLTNAAFVRLLTRMAGQATGANAGQSLAELARLAARDPALLPAYNQLRLSQSGARVDQPAELQPAQ